MSARPAPRLAMGLAAAVVAGLLPLAVAAPAAADDRVCDVAAVPGTERLSGTDTELNPVHDRMHVAEAHDLATGRGIDIAVIDSGVAPLPEIPRSALFLAPGATAAFLSGHGTITAGLIAGKHGVAPGAHIHDVKVFDSEGADPSQGQKPVTSAGIVEGIRAVIAAHPRIGFDVVNISLAVRAHDPALAEAIADLVALDVVVVAAAGNRPAEGVSETGTEGSDADVFPADYPGVLAVSATPMDGTHPASHVLPNHDTDVAAPTYGALSFNATGEACVVAQTATSWAAAEVTGVVALLRQKYPRDNAQQIIARLEATAEGAGAVRSGDDAVDDPWVGAGVVQAHDALSRELRLGRSGRLKGAVPAVSTDAEAPPVPPRFDPLGTPRALLLWFGLLAGALLALVVMLRPLLRRVLK